MAKQKQSKGDQRLVAEIEFDFEHATRALRSIVQAGEDDRAAYGGAMPDIAPSALGRDFGGHAVRINELLTRMHQLGQQRIGVSTEGARQAIAQLELVWDVDAASASALQATGKGGQL